MLSIRSLGIDVRPFDSEAHRCCVRLIDILLNKREDRITALNYSCAITDIRCANCVTFALDLITNCASSRFIALLWLNASTKLEDDKPSVIMHFVSEHCEAW